MSVFERRPVRFARRVPLLTFQSPLRRSHGSAEQLLTLPTIASSSASQFSLNLLNELSPSSSFCVSALSGENQPSITTSSDPKLAHLLFFLQTLEYNQLPNNEDS